MARKLKFREQTDVVSVRLPLSLIERLDGLCQSLRIGRAEFFVALLRKYPELPSPKKARVWIANLSFAVAGGSVVLLAALHQGPRSLSESLTPARGPGPFAPRLEAFTPSPGAPASALPVLPPRDVRDDPNWRPGNMQYLIPRRVAQGSPEDVPALAPGSRPWSR